MFKFFDEMKNKGYELRGLKEFCNEFKTILTIKENKKIVKEAYKTYLDSLKAYENIVNQGVNLIGDVEKTEKLIDKQGKEFLKNSMKRTFRDAYLPANPIKKCRQAELELHINEKIKQILDWDYAQMDK